MKYFPPLFCLVLFFAFAVSAQTNPNSSCPTLDVSGGGIASPGEITSFTANIDTKGKDLNLEYLWTVDGGGKITSGQGTTSITVELVSESDITVTVEVKGLPEGCPNTDSETLGCQLRPTPYSLLVDEFSIEAPQIDKARLADFINELKKNPNSQGYIIEYFKPKTPQKIVNQKFRKIADYLVNELRFEKERITIITNFDKPEYLTKFWIVPPGAEPPTL